MSDLLPGDFPGGGVDPTDKTIPGTPAYREWHKDCCGTGAAFSPISGFSQRVNSQGLTEAQVERLVFLMEECGEVVQACAKILRHGFDSRSPFGFAENNRTKLGLEVGNLEEVIDICARREDFLGTDRAEGRLQKTKNLTAYARHQ